MIQLQPYPTYKDSGVPWLGEIPAHWEVKRLKYYFDEVDRRSITGREVLFSMTRKRGLVPQHEITKRISTPDQLIGYKVCYPNEIVMNRMQAWTGMFFKANSIGLVSPDYAVFKQKCNLNPSFFENLFRSPNFVAECRLRSTGIGSGFNRLYGDEFGKIQAAAPDVTEQTAIARFLDWETVRINKFIRNKRRLIALLKEQKQNVINQAVTRGINPDVKLKSSGVEWLGDIPEHWEIIALRRCSKLVKTGSTPIGANDKYFSTAGFNWFTPSDFRDSLYLKESERQLSEIGRSVSKTFPSNTVMMVGIGATIGKVAISKHAASCNQQINAIVPNERMNAEFLVLFLRSLQHFIISCGKYTTIPILNQDETKSLSIPVPSVAEQQLIVEYISVELKTIDLTISRTEREIELIREYRTRLISDVVTGKVDVRNIEVETVAEEELIEEVEDREEQMSEEEDLVEEVV